MYTSKSWGIMHVYSLYFFIINVGVRINLHVF